MTLSPTLTSSGTRLPLSSMRPGPMARTSPSWGFSLAVSGMTRPEAVVCSASSGLTTRRSSRGLMLTDTSDQPLLSPTGWALPGTCAPGTSGLAMEYAVAGVGLAASSGTLGVRVPTQTLALDLSECQSGTRSWCQPQDRTPRSGHSGCSAPGGPWGMQSVGALAAGTLVALVVAGCGGGPASDSEPSSAP